MPLHRDSQHLHGFITPKGIFHPTRTAQGVTNGCSNFSSRVEPCFQKVREKYNTDPFKAWLDDLLVYAQVADEMVDKLELFFECCEEYNLKLAAMKCELFLRQVNWCGRIIDENGVQFDPPDLVE